MTLVKPVYKTFHKYIIKLSNTIGFHEIEIFVCIGIDLQSRVHIETEIYLWSNSLNGPSASIHVLIDKSLIKKNKKIKKDKKYNSHKFAFLRYILQYFYVNTLNESITRFCLRIDTKGKLPITFAIEIYTPIEINRRNRWITTVINTARQESMFKRKQRE